MLGAVQTSQWLEARMQTCTLSESQTARAVAKSSQQGEHSEHEIVAPKSQRASTDSERVYSSAQAANNKADAKQKEEKLCELFKEIVKELDAGTKYGCGFCDKKFRGSEFVRRHIVNKHEKEVADAIRQAAAAVLEESTPAECLSMARQVPRQVHEAAVDPDMGERTGQANSGPSAHEE